MGKDAIGTEQFIAAIRIYHGDRLAAKWRIC